MTVQIGRRKLLGSAALTGAAVSVSGLAACTGDSGGEGAPPKQGQMQSGVELPVYKELVAVEADLPGDETGVPSGYFTFPKPAEPLFDTPGDGSTITGTMGINRQIPVPMGQNSYWQGLNERLGATWDIDFSPMADYNAKLATLVGSGDMPELVSLPPNLARLPSLMEARFADLTEYLAGTGVQDYPGLANLPSVMWRSTVFNGKINATPTPNLVGSPTPIFHQDVVDQVGANPEPANIEELFEFFEAINDPDNNKYAMAQPGNNVDTVFAPMYGTISGWMVDEGGSFTFGQETAEYREALDFARRCWDAGLFNPDSFASFNNLQGFQSGAMRFSAWGGVGYRNNLKAGVNLGVMTPPKAEGGGPALKPLGNGVFRLCGINKNVDPERIPMLLSVLSWLCAPFGSAEYLYRVFGAEGDGHIWDDELQAPVATDKLGQETMNHYLAASPFELFDPGFQEVTEKVYNYHKEVVPTGVHSADVGLYSPTNDEKRTELNTLLPVGQVIQSNITLEEWDDQVLEWRNAGGDQIREEYQQAYQEANG